MAGHRETSRDSGSQSPIEEEIYCPREAPRSERFVHFVPHFPFHEAQRKAKASPVDWHAAIEMSDISRFISAGHLPRKQAHIRYISPAGAVPGWAGGGSPWGIQDPATGQEEHHRDYTNTVRRGEGGRSTRDHTLHKHERELRSDLAVVQEDVRNSPGQLSGSCQAGNR